MSIIKQLTGMRGVYLVAAELSRLGFIASPTSRSAIGADILATDQNCERTYSVQVKTNASTFGFWLVGAKARKMVSDTHIYVLVNVKKHKGQDNIEYYIVPSKIVAERTEYTMSKTEKRSEWYQVNLPQIAEYRDNWTPFGEAVKSAT